ncbi:hypothetical protein K503DRAFT_117219 [Rhizopogon vinicolor AM-OR11-026]|uniref:Uncharacterized protein n=1 Tax=Rhizopogon vinicolor AM-OR11-026 TaxID=1314800 RepID=A0A1B7N2C7_9AGAM|nr:hypothetical protein K503DRAFT_117219 [Rhizopogon vinicolor AM-OR11-026]
MHDNLLDGSCLHHISKSFMCNSARSAQCSSFVVVDVANRFVASVLRYLRHDEAIGLMHSRRRADRTSCTQAGSPQLALPRVCCMAMGDDVRALYSESDSPVDQMITLICFPFNR